LAAAGQKRPDIRLSSKRGTAFSDILDAADLQNGQVIVSKGGATICLRFDRGESGPHNYKTGIIYLVLVLIDQNMLRSCRVANATSIEEQRATLPSKGCFPGVSACPYIGKFARRSDDSDGDD
jgi:hypothetical protein